MIIRAARTEIKRSIIYSIQIGWLVLIIIIAGILVAGCQQGVTESSLIETAQTPEIEVEKTITSRATVAPTKNKAIGKQAPPTLTTLPTKTPLARPEPSPKRTLTPTPSPTPSITPTATPLGPCVDRFPGDNLIVLVNRQFGLSREFEPLDLVPLSDYLPIAVTKGYQTEVRKVIVNQLVSLIEAMINEGLQPNIISGYRDYSAQAIAWSKWLEQEPDRVGVISAPPGHSEHQLGTTIDFGSPELAHIVGQAGIEFHTYFYQTSEGQWLAENAHSYGFSLSYPLEAFELTGFYYEPWHYRYLGVELATRLKHEEKSLIEHLMDMELEPCLP
jgi:D-alanyl-D-alanine carboxypeptidase